MRYPHLELPEANAAFLKLHNVATLNLYRALANAPAMLTCWLDFAFALRANCTTSRRLRELMILRTAQLFPSTYEWVQHERMALSVGVPMLQIQALENWRGATVFDRQERAAISLAEAMFFGLVSQRVHDELESCFSHAEMIELMMTAGFYCMVPRVLDALGVTTEGEEDVECDRATRAMARDIG